MPKASIGTAIILLTAPVVLLAMVALRGGRPVPVAAVVLSILVGGLAAGLWSSYISRRTRARLLSSREPLSAYEIYARYFADTKLDEHLVTRLWNECAQHLRIPAERLRPTDRFDVELAPTDFFDLFSERTDALAWRMNASAKKQGAPIKLDDIRTLGELVREMAEAGMAHHSS